MTLAQCPRRELCARCTRGVVSCVRCGVYQCAIATREGACPSCVREMRIVRKDKRK